MELRPALNRRPVIYDKAWFMWMFLLAFPPLGIVLMWRQGRFTKRKRFVITDIAVFYFLLPFIIEAITIDPLFSSHDEVVSAFNRSTTELELSFGMENVEKNKEMVSYNITKDITWIENLDDTKQVHEIIMVGQGDGTDILLSMGMLIHMTNSHFDKEDISEVFTKLKLNDPKFNYLQEEISVEKSQVRYNLKFSKEQGVVFTASQVN